MTAMTRPYYYLLIVLSCTGWLSGQSPAPYTLAFTPEGRYPEGIAYQPSDSTIYVTSLADGVVGTIRPDGTYDVFSADAGLISSAGLALDTVRHRLYVAVHDDGASVRSDSATEGRLARLIVLDTRTGVTLRTDELHQLTRGGGRSHGNDVTLDTAGNVYLTDSFRPLIYRVTPAGEASVFLRDPVFEKISQEDDTPALNGITYHPDGFLIVTNYERGRLYRIPLDDPTTFAEITLSDSLQGADGIELVNANQLAVARTYTDTSGTFVSEVAVVTSYDGWQSARLTQQLRPSTLDCPTTVKIVRDELYATNSKFRELFEAPEEEQTTEAFTLTRIALPVPSIPRR